MSENSRYPLSWPDGWPRTKFPSRSRFGTYYDKPSIYDATTDLMNELRKLGALNVILSSNVELRNDGLPRSDRRPPSDKGVAVYFTLKNRKCVLACDRWETVGCNIHAIAKHVEALRSQDRWGVGTVEQAFHGYTAIPEKTGSQWWEVLGVPINATKEQAKDAYRLLAKKHHPDVGGDADLFRRINEAWQQCDTPQKL